LSLAVGRYHVVIEKFHDFNVSETDIKVSAGHVHNFKANLSQGVFMSFLRTSANVTGAHVWLDDPKKERPAGDVHYPKEHPSKVLGPGTAVPDFTLRTTPDQSVSSSDFRGCPLILAFLSGGLESRDGLPHYCAADAVPRHDSRFRRELFPWVQNAAADLLRQFLHQLRG